MKFCRIEEVLIDFPSINYKVYMVRCPEMEAIPLNGFGKGKFYFQYKDEAEAFAAKQEIVEQQKAELKQKKEREARKFYDDISSHVRKVLKVKLQLSSIDGIAVYGQLADLQHLPEEIQQAAQRMGTWLVYDAKLPDGRCYRVALDALGADNRVLQLS